MPAEDPRERTLVLRLELVVELLVDPQADLLGDGLHVEARRHPLDDAHDQPEVRHVGAHRGATPGYWTFTATSRPSCSVAR